MARAERIDRRDLKEDKFIETMAEVYAFLKRNLQLILIAVAAVLVVLIAAGTYAYMRQKAETKASIQFGEAMKLFQEAEDDWADQDKMKEAADKYKEARRKFKVIIRKYKGSSYADKAAFYVAKSSFQLGEYDRALKEFKDLAEKSDSLFGLYAQQAVGKCYEQKGDLEKAVREYDESRYGKFRGLPEYEFVLAEVTLSRAICREKLNQISQAVKDYERLTRMFQDNLREAIDRKSAQMIERAKKLLKRLFKESPPSQKILSTLEKADSLSQSGRHFEALKTYAEAMRQYRAEKERAKAISLNNYRRLAKYLGEIEELLKDLRDGDEKLSKGQISSALSSYQKAVGIDFAPGRDIAEKAYLKLSELKGRSEAPVGVRPSR
ncbi:tetratricopeptide repeat protein [Candidatus Poribacteria bacterium]|nr:tetratricopeptide repeat protein [Candidatus Poribacteria bacterium]